MVFLFGGGNAKVGDDFVIALAFYWRYTGNYEEGDDSFVALWGIFSPCFL